MPPEPLYLAGTWRETRDVAVIRSPYDGREVGRASLAGDAEMREAVAAAFESREMARTLPAHRRAAALDAMAASLAARAEEFARLITEEMGKTLRESRAEVARAVQTFRLSAIEAGRLGGEWIDLDLAPGLERRFALVRRFPRGVVAGIAPFNFPLNLVAHKLGPAVACGAPIVVKPSPRTPLVALRLASLVAETDLPPGMVSVLPAAAGPTTTLAEDPRVRVVSFTGSAAVGWPLRGRLAGKKVVLELGGDAAVVVEPDADVAHAAARTAAGAFAIAGQSCISVQRALVAREVRGDFVAELVRAAESLSPGDPLDERTTLAPLVDAAAAERVEAWIAEAVAGGARVLTGGTRKGTFVAPTVLENVPPVSRIACEEVFGPVVSVAAYDSFEEGLAAVNRSRYGLQAGLFTRDLARALLAFRTLEVGALLLNEIPTWRADAMPYGGTKLSGTGREGPRWAIHDMTEPRVLVLEHP